MSWLDLHMHTNISGDGEFSPRELMKQCRDADVRVAAIADHNAVRGVAEGLEAASEYGVTLIPAVELDCEFEGVNLHLLGYWIDPSHEGFARAEQNILEQERAAALRRIELVAAQGIYLDRQEILRCADNGVVTGELIGELALARAENQENPLLAPYRTGGARADNPLVNFYWDFCAQGKPAYVPILFPSLAEAAALVRKSGGVPVLAHPACNLGKNADLFRRIIQQGVAGAEVFSSYHTPEETAFYLALAEELGAALTCGSDYHGKIKPKIQLGCVGCGGREAELLVALERRRQEEPACRA